MRRRGSCPALPCLWNPHGLLPYVLLFLPCHGKRGTSSPDFSTTSSAILGPCRLLPLSCSWSLPPSQLSTVRETQELFSYVYQTWWWFPLSSSNKIPECFIRKVLCWAPLFDQVKKALMDKWSAVSELQISDLPNGFKLVRCASHDAMKYLLNEGPWSLGGLNLHLAP